MFLFKECGKEKYKAEIADSIDKYHRDTSVHRSVSFTPKEQL